MDTLRTADSEQRPHLRPIWIGLAVMFVLIGIAAVLAVLYPPASSTSSTNQSIFSNYFSWIPGALAGLIGIGFLFLIFGWLFAWPWRPYWRRRWRYYSGGWPWDDSAVAILRERYARGEITKEQFDQMIRDLEAQHR